MSILSEFADRHGADLAEIKADVEKLGAAIKKLDKMIEDFQNSPGTLPPEDQKRLDDLQTAMGELKQSVANVLTDAETPPTTNPTPEPETPVEPQQAFLGNQPGQRGGRR